RGFDLPILLRLLEELASPGLLDEPDVPAGEQPAQCVEFPVFGLELAEQGHASHHAPAVERLGHLVLQLHAYLVVVDDELQDPVSPGDLGEIRGDRAAQYPLHEALDRGWLDHETATRGTSRFQPPFTEPADQQGGGARWDAQYLRHVQSQPMSLDVHHDL